MTLFETSHGDLVEEPRPLPLNPVICSEPRPKQSIAFVLSSSFLFLIVRPGAPSSVLAPSSDALCY